MHDVKDKWYTLTRNGLLRMHIVRARIMDPNGAMRLVSFLGTINMVCYCTI